MPGNIGGYWSGGLNPSPERYQAPRKVLVCVFTLMHKVKMSPKEVTKHWHNIGKYRSPPMPVNQSKR